MSRPLTNAERTKIQVARRKIEKLREQISAAELERDRAILDAYERRGNVGELAEAAGVARQTVHAIVNRLGES